MASDLEVGILAKSVAYLSFCACHFHRLLWHLWSWCFVSLYRQLVRWPQSYWKCKTFLSRGIMLGYLCLTLGFAAMNSKKWHSFQSILIDDNDLVCVMLVCTLHSIQVATGWRQLPHINYPCTRKHTCPYWQDSKQCECDDVKDDCGAAGLCFSPESCATLASLVCAFLSVASNVPNAGLTTLVRWIPCNHIIFNTVSGYFSAGNSVNVVIRDHQV